MEDDYQGDDYPEDYDDENVSQDKSKGMQGEDTAILEKTAYTETANPGSNVKLQCHVKNLTKINIIMWYNGTKLLHHGNTNIVEDKRIEVDKDNSLIIHNVNVYDDQIYRCKVLPKADLIEEVTLHVISPPSEVTITRDNSIVNDEELEVASGEKVEFKCSYARGRPQANIKWAKNVCLQRIFLVYRI